LVPSFLLGPERLETLTIWECPSLRIKRVRRARWAPRPTNIPTSNAKRADRSSGPQTRRPRERVPNVPSADSSPYIRYATFRSVFAYSSAHSRSGYYDNAPDRRCASYEASRSSHATASPQEPRGKEGFNDVQEVALISILLIISSLHS